MSHHFMFQGKPLPDPGQLIIHQIYWSTNPCPCQALDDQTSFGGVWSFVSPVRHHETMMSAGLICRHCNTPMEVTTRIEYVPVNDNDQILADLPVEAPLQ